MRYHITGCDQAIVFGCYRARGAMKKSSYIAALIILTGSLCSAQEPAMPDEEQTLWLPRDWLMKSLVAAVPGMLEKQDLATGRFGSKPWICQDQNVIFPLAAAWAMEHGKNPYYHDEDMLAAICKGGEALVTAQDKDGKWTFRKKDGSTWGQIHMPWTYSRWIRAYSLVKESMPADASRKWKAGLLLGFGQIQRYMARGHIHNIPTHHAMALYIAGKCLGNEKWQRSASGFMKKVVEKQDPDGFWSENFGPVVGYNQVYMDALGIYYSVSGDKAIQDALKRSAIFHASFLWSDGTPVAAIDERQIYHRRRNIGNPGFSHTPEGRGYLLHQTAVLRSKGHSADADYAAAMLVYGAEGAGTAVISSSDQARIVLGRNNALMQRDRPWQFCLSGYCCPVPANRWIQDRQNFMDVFHDDLGLIAGGGNTKLQPYWSTFTVGKPGLLKHMSGDSQPNFRPHIDLLWVPDEATLLPNQSSPALRLRYGKDICTLTTRPRENGDLQLVYRTTLTSGKPVEAHLPLMKRQGGLRLASGRTVYLNSTSIEIPAHETGGSVTWSGLRVTIPAGTRLVWPAWQHNPYKKDGSSSLSNAKLVLVMPFSATRLSHTVALSHQQEEPFPGLVFEARKLHVTSPSKTRMKPLGNLGSFFLAATEPGDAMIFELPIAEAGTYEFMADFVTFPGYGIVQLAVDGTILGEPFDAYTPELDCTPPVSFGVLELGKGMHHVTVKIVGRNPKSDRYFISVKRFLLKSLKQ